MTNAYATQHHAHQACSFHFSVEAKERIAAIVAALAFIALLPGASLLMSML